MNKRGKLYLCGTPLGNLKDITFRSLEILQKVDMIAAEDTRRTSQLLNFYNIKTSLTSYHEHNEKKRTLQLLALLKEGKNLALVSDAGMPGISDPGKELIGQAIKEKVEVIPVPGPTALISALVVSGLNMEKFVFEGFLPRKGKERKQCLANLKWEERTIILYESPYRLKKTLQELLQILGNRRAVVVRELTKLHEEKIYGLIDEVLADLDQRRVKGEIVLVVEGNKKEQRDDSWEGLSILEHLQYMLDGGFTKKQAIKEVANLRGIPKREVYKEAVRITHVDKENKF